MHLMNNGPYYSLYSNSESKKKERSIFYFLSEHPPRHPHQTVASKDIITLLILENNAFSPYTKTHTHNTNQHLKQPCQILCSSLNKWPNILMRYYISCISSIVVLEKKNIFHLNDYHIIIMYLTIKVMMIVDTCPQ